MAGVESMTDVHDIRGTISGNNTLLLLVIVIIILLIIFLISSYVLFYIDKRYRQLLFQKIAKTFEKKIDYKAETIKQFINLSIYVKRNHTLEQIFAFYKISQILRWYVENMYKNNALKKTKAELLYMKIEDMNKILDMCYPIQYAGQVVNPEFTLSVINLSINVIKKWN
jgi:hypothetical protein